MSGRSLLGLLAMLFLAGCAVQTGAPRLGDLPSGATLSLCSQVAPQGKWRFVHQIDFDRGDGHPSTLIGISVVDGEQVQLALTTIEGLTLFAARSRGSELEVIRAVAPFNGKAFAAGLLADVRLLLLPMAGSSLQGSVFHDGVQGCRLVGGSGAVVDILPRESGCWQINQYRDNVLRRRIRTRHCHLRHAYRLPGDMTLEALDTGYRLRLHLLEYKYFQP